MEKGNASSRFSRFISNPKLKLLDQVSDPDLYPRSEQAWVGREKPAGWVILKTAVQTTEFTETHGKQPLVRAQPFTCWVKSLSSASRSVPCHSVLFRGSTAFSRVMDWPWTDIVEPASGQRARLRNNLSLPSRGKRQRLRRAAHRDDASNILRGQSAKLV